MEILSSKDKPHFGHCLYTISTGIYELGIVPWESAWIVDEGYTRYSNVGENYNTILKVYNETKHSCT